MLTRPNRSPLSMMEDQLFKTKAKIPALDLDPLQPPCDPSPPQPAPFDPVMQADIDSLQKKRREQLDKAKEQRKKLRDQLEITIHKQMEKSPIEQKPQKPDQPVDCGIHELAKALLNFMYDPSQEGTPAPGAPKGIIGIKVPADDQQRLMGGQKLVDILQKVVSPSLPSLVLLSCSMLNQILIARRHH
jgi:hypothetical protein